jgi:hypothetical protein
VTRLKTCPEIKRFGPKEDGTYVVQFRTSDGNVLAIPELTSNPFPGSASRKAFLKDL